jgi:hypothetical protein
MRATLGAKIGDAVFARTLDLTKPRASDENTRHSVRIADNRRDGPIKYELNHRR